MITLACGHEGTPADSRLCVHLRTRREGSIRYVQWFLGSGLDADFLCEPCVELRTAGEAVIVDPICKECHDFAATKVGALVGIRGKPGVLTRAEPFRTELRESTFPQQLGAIEAMASIDGEQASVWLLLAEDGSLVRFDAQTEGWAKLASSSVPSESDLEPWAGHAVSRRLHVSGDGAFAAVVNDYGRHGQILNLRSGAVTATLDGGDDDFETVPFSFTFARREGRVIAIHRTAWNRLDVTDAETGALLSDRQPTSYQQGQARPAHYLDYFHGAILVNPAGTYLADDGWVWHPVGVVTAFSLEAWAENAWESEDGPTRTHVCARDYY